MERLIQSRPDLRKILLVMFNVYAIRKACILHLLSKEFLLGCFLWGVSVEIILLQGATAIAIPAPILTIIKIFSVFSGCCWVAFPIFVYLKVQLDRQMQKTLKTGSLFQFLTGVSLWHQTVRGKLPAQFLGAIFVGIGLAVCAFKWQLNSSWQVLFVLAFAVNALFFLLFPLLLFLGKWINRGIQQELHQGRKQQGSYNKAMGNRG